MLLLLDLHLPLPPEMAKQEALSDPDSLAPLVPANRPLAEGDLDLRRLEQHLVRARLLAGRAKPQDSRRR